MFGSALYYPNFSNWTSMCFQSFSGFGFFFGIFTFYHFVIFDILRSKEGIIAHQSCLEGFALPWCILLNLMMPKCQKCQNAQKKISKKPKCQQRCQEGKKAKYANTIKMPRWHLKYLMNMMLHFGSNYVNMREKDQILKYPTCWCPREI